MEYARRAEATEIVLTSHTALVEAIRLYESMGFRHAPLPADVRYETANVFIHLTLSKPLSELTEEESERASRHVAAP